MQTRAIGFGLLIALLVGSAAGVPRAGRSRAVPAQQKKEYLSELEADKIREAMTPSERIKLFVEFAAERLRKLQYELSRPSTDRRRAELLNSLLNGYTGCLDDAAELVQLGLEKQTDIRLGLKEMQKKAPEFLKLLQGLAENGAEREKYQSTLEDAIEATQDAVKEAEKAAKEYAPPPVRRKQ